MSEKIITGGKIVMSGKEDRLLIWSKLLVKHPGIPSRISSELDEDAKLGLR